MKKKRMKIASPLLLLVGALSTGVMLSPVALAQALTPDQLTLQVKKLDAKSKQSEKTLSTVDNELKSVKQQLGKMERLVDNRAMIEMLQRVDVLADEASQLYGQLEQQNHDLDDLKKRQRELYLDTDRRLRDLESRTPEKSSRAPVTIPGLPEVSTPSVDVAVTNSANQTVEPAASADANIAAATSDLPVIASNTTSSEDQAAYQAAFDTLKEGRYNLAKTELKAFLQNHSSSSFAGNAQYWLGEAHYVTREFKQGVEEFKTVLSGYPGSLKVPDAMLKLGYTYYELKQYDQAKLLLEDLRERFPKSTAFRLAGKRLDRIRKEGH
jgi:tol-pal system protein YbgF